MEHAVKTFLSGGVYFFMTSFEISKVPLTQTKDNCQEEQNPGSLLAQKLCESACYLSGDGSGQIAVEFLRIAPEQKGRAIRHLITVRSYGNTEQKAKMQHKMFVQELYEEFVQNGYVLKTIAFDNYRIAQMKMCTDTNYALIKNKVTEHGLYGTYDAPPIVTKADWKSIYAALDGSGGSLCIQMIPQMFSVTEKNLITRKSKEALCAAQGVMPHLRDQFADTVKNRWKYFADRMTYPAAEINIIVSGSKGSAVRLTSTFRQSVDESAFTLVPLKQYRYLPVYNQPWMVSRDLKNSGSQDFLKSIYKWTSEEAGVLCAFPSQMDYFVGVSDNAYALAPENSLLPAEMTKAANKTMQIGTTISSRQNMYFPDTYWLLHTAVLGKSGTGKTTFLKQLIQQFYEKHIPVLVLEPVKQEYRDLLMEFKQTNIFTVEAPVMPFLLNPFLLPAGVPLHQYKGSLLAAFKAAISLPDPLPALLEKAVSEAYMHYGWSDFSKTGDANVQVFGMAEFIRIFKTVIARSNYSAEVKGNMMSGGAYRLQSMIERCTWTFDTVHATSVEELLKQCSLLEMGNLEREEKMLVTALVLIRVMAFLKATRRSDHVLKNIILLDEAHAFLDISEGITEEERSLNNSMRTLMLNMLTELRAYGVGVIFADQSPSRMGAAMLDNVENLISFRLTGKEAELFTEHMGTGKEMTECLSRMPTGDFLIKNQYLVSPVAVRMYRRQNALSKAHCTDLQVLNHQKKYLAEHFRDYSPYTECERTGCRYCSAAVRTEARKLATQIYRARQHKIRNREELAAHIRKMPDAMKGCLQNYPAERRMKICNCTAVHLVKMCMMEKGIVL